MKIYSLLMSGILLIYFIELIFPPLNAIFNSDIICVSCLFFWLLLSFFRDREFYLRIRLGLFVALLYYLATSFLPYLFGNYIIAHRYIALGLVPLGYLIYSFHFYHNEMNIIKNILKITTFFLIITEFITVNALINDPYISRSIKSSGELSNSLSAMGIGGYSIIYFVSISLIILIHLYLTETKRKNKVFWGLLSILGITLVLKSSYMTAVLISLVEILVYFGVKVLRKSRNNIAVFFGGMAAIATILYIVSINIDVFIEFLPPRIQQILNLNNSIISAIFIEFTADRLPTLQTSFETFIENPLFGLIGAGDLSYDGEFLRGFGQHSFYFDTFALYGFFLGIASIYVTTLPFHKAEKKRAVYGELKWSVLTGLIILCVLNNVTEAIGLLTGIIYPFVRDKNMEG